MYKGIFWLVTDIESNSDIVSVKVSCDADGNTLENVSFSSKDGSNFTHKVEWERLPSQITQGKPYNYFPRGRVEYRKGKVIVFCHPTLTQDKYREMITTEFELQKSAGLPIVFKADGSYHYQALNEKDSNCIPI